MHEMKAIKESLKFAYGTRTCLVHNHNEHSRGWDIEGIDDLACRAERTKPVTEQQRVQPHGIGHERLATLAKN
jgi:hypothetical protein